MKIMKNFIIATLFCTLLCVSTLADEIQTNLDSLPENVDTEEVVETSTENNEEQESKIVFTDVPEDSPYAQSIYKLAEHGVINGYEDGSFKPEGEITRAEMTKMITLTFGITDFSDAAGFPDVAETDWFYPYVLALQKKGAVNGYEDGAFRQANKVTREQICKIVVECAGLTALPIPNIATISDEISTTWDASKYVYIIVNSYLMPLEENNTFRATEPIKRYELANLLSKFVIEPIKPITANVRFFVGDKQYGATDVVAIGDNALPPEITPVPEDPENYVFEGWKVKGTSDKEIVEVAFAIVEKDVDYEAVFVKLHTVTFYNGNDVFDIQRVANGHLADEPISKPVFGDGTWVFDGWYFTNEPVVQNEAKVNFLRYEITKDENFYARYTDSNTNPDIGGDTPSTPQNPNSEEMMEKLNRGYTQLNSLSLTVTSHINLVSIVVDCIDKLITDAKNGNLIDKVYVDTYYGLSHVQPAKDIYENMPVKEATPLYNIIMDGVEKDIRDFMMETFDLEMPDM